MEALTYNHWVLLTVGSLIMGLSKGGIPGAGNLTVAIFALALEDALGPIGVPLSFGYESTQIFFYWNFCLAFSNCQYL